MPNLYIKQLDLAGSWVKAENESLVLDVSVIGFGGSIELRANGDDNFKATFPPNVMIPIGRIDLSMLEAKGSIATLSIIGHSVE